MRTTANSNTSLSSSAGYGREYASPADFCAIFSQDMDRLYWLALVLTGSHETAQRCFLAALDDCHTEAVFPDWARSWSRRAVIKSAIRMVNPVLTNGASEFGLEVIANEMDRSVRPLFQCGRLDRFVFVMSVLEGYSTRECAVLLGCSLREVEQARVRVFQGIALSGRDLVQTWHHGAFRTEQHSALTLR